MNVIWFLFGGVLALQERAVSDYLKGGQHPGVMEILLRIGGVSGVELLDGDWWRLLTSGFVHIGLFHLLCNMVTLGLLGTVAEGVWGRWRFILIYLLAGLASSVTAMALHPQTESAGGMQDVLLGGASGSLWGLTAALAVWLLSNLKHLPADVGPDWTRKLLLIVVMNVVVSFQPGVSLEGHLGGGVCGVLVALCLGRIRGDHRETVGAVLGLVLVVTVFATGFGLAFTRSNDWREVKARWSARQSPPVVPPNRLQDAPTRRP
jgi:membrane associated rhomboid family serine protease